MSWCECVHGSMCDINMHSTQLCVCVRVFCGLGCLVEAKMYPCQNLGSLQGSFGRIQGSFGRLPGSFGSIEGSFDRI